MSNPEVNVSEVAPEMPAPKKAGKKITKKRLRRLKGRRMTREQRLARKVRHNFWQWEELYKSALTALIASLAKGRKLTPDAIVKLAIGIADKGQAAIDARRPADLED